MASSPSFDLDLLPTERARPGLEDLDTRESTDLVDLLLAAESRVPELLASIRSQLAAAVDLVVEALGAGGRLIYVGAGTPGRLAQLDALECVPTFGVAPGRVLAVMAGGPAGTDGAFEEGEDDGDAAHRDLAAVQLATDDLVVGITASGRTPYVLESLRFARRRDVRTVAVTNNLETPVAMVADLALEVPTGAEVLAGSTRLTAGTAQKIVLNTLSTAAMIRSGRSYGAWMVDVQPSNRKLRQRAQRIVREVTGASAERVRETLVAADQQTRTAVVMLLAHLDAPQARRRLESHGGSIREVLASLGIDIGQGKAGPAA